jgi:hypothetical protein
MAKQQQHQQKPTDRTDQEQPSRQPVHEIRLGRIKAAIWANPTDDGVRYATTVTRLFKDDERGEWRSTHGFGREDLLTVAEVARQAAAWVFATSQNEDASF